MKRDNNSGYCQAKNNWRKFLPLFIEILKKSKTVDGATLYFSNKTGIKIDRRELANIFSFINKELMGNKDGLFLYSPLEYIGGKKIVDKQTIQKMITYQDIIPETQIINKDIGMIADIKIILKYIKKCQQIGELPSIVELADYLGKSPKQVKALIAYAERNGYSVAQMPEGGEIYSKSAAQSPWGSYMAVEIRPIKGMVKFLAIADTHFGSIRETIPELKDCIKYAIGEGCQFGVLAGDFIDGVRVYRGQQNESIKYNIDWQRDYFISEFPKHKDFRWILVSGNHDLRTYEDVGHDPGEAVASKREDFTYLGMYNGRIKIKNIVSGTPPIEVELHHHDKAGAYAISYHLQKMIESYEGGDKPQITIVGHTHQTIHMPLYRNVHGFLAGCFQGQTLFLKRKHVTPRIGGWIITVKYDTRNWIKTVSGEFVEYYAGRKTPERVAGWKKER